MYFLGGNDDPKGDSDADREDTITLYLWSYHDRREENANLEYCVCKIKVA